MVRRFAGAVNAPDAQQGRSIGQGPALVKARSALKPRILDLTISAERVRFCEQRKLSPQGVRRHNRRNHQVVLISSHSSW
jgi:hypothetical protein